MTTFLVTAALGLLAAPDGAATVTPQAALTTVQQQDQDDAAPQRRRGRGGQQRDRDQPQRDRRGGQAGFGRFTPPANPLLTALDADEDGVISAEEIEKAAAALKTLDKNEDGKLSGEEMNPLAARGFGEGRGFGFRGRFDGRGEPDDRARAGERGEPGRGQFGRGQFRGQFERGQFGRGRFGGQRGLDRPRGAPGGAFGFGGANSVQSILSRDQNGDGKVTKDEWLAPMERVFDRADANGDGALDKAELERMAERAGPRGRGNDARGRRGFGGFGGPGRGANFAARLMERDADGDGKVTQEELPENMQRIFGRFDANGDGAIDKAEADRAAEAVGPRRGGGRGPRDARPRRRPEAENAPEGGRPDDAPRDDEQAK